MHRLSRLRSEEGIILPLAMIILIGLLALVTLVVDSGVTTSQQATVQINRRTALANADSGLQAGIYRLSSQPWAQVSGKAYAINPLNCFGTQDDGAPTASTGVCNGAETKPATLNNATVTDILGSMGSYSYNITPELKNGTGPGCTGWWVGGGGASYGGVTQRCITATGTYHGVTRRIQERIAAEAWVFPTNGMLSMNEMNWDTSNSQHLVLPGLFQANGQMTIGKAGSTQSIPNDLSQAILESPNKIAFNAGNACTGTCIYHDPTTTPPLTTPIPRGSGPGPQDFKNAVAIQTTTGGDALLTGPTGVANCNWSSIYNPATHVFSGGCGTAAKFPNGGTGTQGVLGAALPSGVYVFCNMTVTGELTTKPNSQVTIYIDSPGSGDGWCGSPAAGGACKQSPGTLSINGTGFYNPNPNPDSLRIFIYGNQGCATPLTKQTPLGGEMKIDNSGNMLDPTLKNTLLTNAQLFAPDTYLTTLGNGIFWSGGIVVGGVESNDNDIWGFTQHPPTQEWFPTAWHECSATPSNPADPGSGCY
jgi:Tfp pilus assembly protein PilX